MSNPYNIKLRTEFDSILEIALPYVIFGSDKDKLVISGLVNKLWYNAYNNNLDEFEAQSKELTDYIQNIELPNQYESIKMTHFKTYRKGIQSTVNDLAYRVDKLESAGKKGKLSRVDTKMPTEKKCPVCEAAIDSEKRSMYCSNKCKQVAYRRRQSNQVNAFIDMHINENVH